MPDVGCGMLPTTFLTPIKTDDAQGKIEFRDKCGSEHTLGGPKYYRTLNSSLIISELLWLVSLHPSQFLKLFHHFLLSARSGSTRYHNTLSNKISSDCISKNIDGLMHSMHSVFFRKPKLIWSQELWYPNPYPTLLHCGKNHFLRHSWEVNAIFLPCRGIRCLNSLLSSCTRH